MGKVVQGQFSFWKINGGSEFPSNTNLNFEKWNLDILITINLMTKWGSPTLSFS